MSKKTKGFTIVELLTVMSIIIILMGVLVPALNRVRRFAKIVTQRGQFHEISKGLELYRNDHQETYPDSSALDSNGVGYCGAMRLCEAMVGQDGMGFNPSSKFQAQTDLYLFNLCSLKDPSLYSDAEKANLRERIKYVDVENIKAYRLQDAYPWLITTGSNFYTPTGTFSNTVNANGDRIPNAVIGDVFLRANTQAGYCPERGGEKVGMPVLYYKADPSKLANDYNTIPDAATPNTNIYNFDDNYGITMLGCPWEGGAAPTTNHPMYLPNPPGPLLFYKAITNTKIPATPKPHNEDGYILVSAGWDGLYGTKDDVYNFTD